MLITSNPAHTHDYMYTTIFYKSGTLFVPYLPSDVVNHLYDFLHVLFKDFEINVKFL